MRPFHGGKRILLASFILIVALLVFPACRGSEGEPGPTGIPGEQGPQGPPGPTLPKPEASVVLSSNTIIMPTGATIVYGSGFIPGEAVQVVLVAAVGGEDLDLMSTVANLSGAFATPEVTVPETVQPGVYTLRVRGDEGSVASTALVVVLQAK